jgi:phage-related protein
MWKVVYDGRLEKWLETISADVRAKILRIVELLVTYGPQNVKEPYVKAVRGHRKLFEIRAKGRDGIARVFYFTYEGQRLVLLHGFMKKTQKTPQREIEVALARMKEAVSELSR